MEPMDFYSTCRMCAGPANPTSISLNDDSDVILWAINNYNITLDSSLPMRICHPCIDIMNKTREFQRRYHDSQKKFLKLRQMAITIESREGNVMMLKYGPYIPVFRPILSPEDCIIREPPSNMYSTILITKESQLIMGINSEENSTNIIREPVLESSEELNQSNTSMEVRHLDIRTNATFTNPEIVPENLDTIQNIMVKTKPLDLNSNCQHSFQNIKSELKNLEKQNQIHNTSIKELNSTPAIEISPQEKTVSENMEGTPNIMVKTEPLELNLQPSLQSMESESDNLEEQNQIIAQRNSTPAIEILTRKDTAIEILDPTLKTLVKAELNPLEHSIPALETSLQSLEETNQILHTEKGQLNSNSNLESIFKASETALETLKVENPKKEQYKTKNEIVQKTAHLLNKWFEKNSNIQENIGNSESVKKEQPEEMNKIQKYDLKEFKINLIRLSTEQINSITKNKSSKVEINSSGNEVESRKKVIKRKKKMKNVPQYNIEESSNSSCDTVKVTEYDHSANLSDDTVQFDSDATLQYDSDATLQYDSDATVCADIDVMQQSDTEQDAERHHVTGQFDSESRKVARDSTAHLNNADLSKLPIPWPKDDTKSSSTASSSESYKCSVCLKIYTSDFDLTAHFKSEHSENMVRCDLCVYLAKNKYILKKHVENKHVNASVKCKICDKNISDKYNLKIHIKNVHSSTKDIKCKYCDKKYSSLNDLNEHMNSEHKNTKSFQCKECLKSFKFIQCLKSHITFAHTEVRPFSCKICSKTFKTRANLRIHRITHEDNRDFVCPTCDKGFKDKYKLRRHINNVHTTERIFVCEICSKSYRSLKDLKIHKQRHNIKTFKCSECLGIFKTKQELSKHIEIHKKEKYFKCDVCNLSFKSKAEVSTHSKTHNSVRNHKCLQCNKQYKTRDDLRKHKLTHKNVGTFLSMLYKTM